MNSQRSLGIWTAFVVSILLWVGAIYGLWYIEQEKNNHAERVSKAEQEAQLLTTSSRLHGLLNDTKDERNILQGIITDDVIATVDSIDAAGKTAGIEVQISNAIPENTKAGPVTGSPVAVSFVIQSEGAFAQLSQFIDLLGSLSVPTSIQQIDLTHTGPSKWHLSVRIRALTAPETTTP